nr:unnamed protein product [Digitaria exilis]
MFTSRFAFPGRPGANKRSTKMLPGNPRLVHGSGLVVALATISVAINLVAVCEPPPPGLDKNAYYFLAPSVIFFSGVAHVFAAVSATEDRRGRSGLRAAPSKLKYAAVAPLIVVVAVMRGWGPAAVACQAGLDIRGEKSAGGGNWWGLRGWSGQGGDDRWHRRSEAAGVVGGGCRRAVEVFRVSVAVEEATSRPLEQGGGGQQGWGRRESPTPLCACL